MLNNDFDADMKQMKKLQNRITNFYLVITLGYFACVFGLVTTVVYIVFHFLSKVW